MSYLPTGDLATTYAPSWAPKLETCKSCCSACAGGGLGDDGHDHGSKNIAVYGILVVGGLLWFMHSAGRK